MKHLDLILAEKLLKISAIKLQPENPFTWASGWNSPIYTDNRKTLSYPDVRSFIKVELSRIILENFPEVEAVAGVATGAGPQGALVSDTLGLPYVYVRSTPKDHGLENLIEGDLRPGTKVVVVEDLVSTGGSSLKAVQAIRNAGCEVVGMVAIFSYEFPVAGPPPPLPAPPVPPRGPAVPPPAGPEPWCGGFPEGASGPPPARSAPWHRR